VSADLLADALRACESKLALVITGAGVSLASGIPTFRGADPGAVWAASVMEMGTRRFFRRDPVTSWRWYFSRFAKALDARPNPAHHALVALERWQLERGSFLLVTQNIDGLHADAGSRALAEVHGTAHRVRCPRFDACEHASPHGSLPRAPLDAQLRRLVDDPRPEHLPLCPGCGDVLRPHILWFDEMYTEHDDFQWERVVRATERAALVLFLGTSLSVGVTELALQAARKRGARVIVVDPAPPEQLPGGVTTIAAKVEELLPAVMERLGPG
jgi:NAD-dependent deacetylase